LTVQFFSPRRELRKKTAERNWILATALRIVFLRLPSSFIPADNPARPETPRRQHAERKDFYRRKRRLEAGFIDWFPSFAPVDFTGDVFQNTPGDLDAYIERGGWCGVRR
jgi:hypothetical protein